MRVARVARFGVLLLALGLSSSLKVGGGSVQPQEFEVHDAEEANGEDAGVVSVEADTIDPSAFKAASTATAGSESKPEAAAPAEASASATPGQANSGAEGSAAPAAAGKAFNLEVELSLARTMGNFGMIGDMMKILYNITFELGDTDHDGKLSKPECIAFTEAHVQPASKITKALGLTGGHLQLTNKTAVEETVDGIISTCDTNSDALLEYPELQSCTRHLYGLLRQAIMPQAAATAAAGTSAAGRAGAAAGAGAGAGAAGGGGSLFDQLMKQAQGGQQASSAGASAAGASAGGASPFGASFGGSQARRRQQRQPLPFERQLQRLKAGVLANLRNPNFNTYLGGLGVAALVLREGLSLDVFNLRHNLRGFVGRDVQDFLSRLRNVALGCLLAAAFGRFDDIGAAA